MADDERLWEVGYDGHQRAQRRRLAATPLAEKIAWLEEAHRIVLRLARARPGAAAPPADHDPGAPATRDAKG